MVSNFVIVSLSNKPFNAIALKSIILFANFSITIGTLYEPFKMVTDSFVLTCDFKKVIGEWFSLLLCWLASTFAIIGLLVDWIMFSSSLIDKFCASSIAIKS